MSFRIKEENEKALRERFPEVVDGLEQWDGHKDGEPEPFIQKIDSISILAVNKGNELFRLNSLYSSETMTDFWYNEVFDESVLKPKVVMFGFGNGEFIKKFLAKAPEDAKIYVYEPCVNIFSLVVSEYDVSEIINDKRFVLYINGLDKKRNFSNIIEDDLSITDVKTIILTSHPNYPCLFKKEYQTFCDYAQRAVTIVYTNYSFMGTWGQRLNENIEHNLLQLIDSYSLTGLEEVCEDFPAIIVGAGPSLDKNVDELKKAKGKSLILATDSAVRTLSAHGIVPDMIISVDPIKDEKYLGGNDFEETPLLTSVHAGWKLVSAHKGKQFFENKADWHIQSYLTANDIVMPVFDTAGSVASTAYSFARFLNCRTIILVGMDLAYTNDKTHTEHSTVAHRTIEDIGDEESDIDIYGNSIRSSADMKSYKIWFEERIQKYPEIKIVDATEGGALIVGTEILKLKEAIDKYCTLEFDVQKAFNNAKPLFDKQRKETFIEYVSGIPDAMEENIRKIKKINQYYEKMLDLIYRNKYNTGEMKRLSRQSNDLLFEVENDPLMDFARNGSNKETNEIYENVNCLEKDEKTELISVIEIGKQYINCLKDSIETVMPEVKEMIDRFEDRKLEDKE